MSKEHSDGSSANYYQLPNGSTQLQDLISAKDMNAQIGEIFRACYRYGEVDHSPKLRDAKKIKFYIDAEIERLEKLDKKLIEKSRSSATIEDVPEIIDDGLIWVADRGQE